MRFSLRTLLIFMLLLGPLSALGWTKYQAWREEQERMADLRHELYVFTFDRVPLDPNLAKSAKQYEFRGRIRKHREEISP